MPAYREIGGINIYGLAETQANLLTLSDKVARNQLMKSAKIGLKIVQDEARRTAPKKTGFGRKHIVIRRRKSKRYSLSMVIGPTREAFYMAILEVGTYRKPGGYEIKAKKKRFLGFGNRVYRIVHHPGIKARHWFKNIYDRTKEAVAITTSYALEKGVEEEAAKLSGKGQYSRSVGPQLTGWEGT